MILFLNCNTFSITSYYNGSKLVCPEDRGANAIEPVKHVFVRMTVFVAFSDGYDRIFRLYSLQELFRAGCAAAVMGYFQHIRLQVNAGIVHHIFRPVFRMALPD